MKIDFALMSSTPDPFYIDFWPLVANMWRDVIGIEPVLIYSPDDGAVLDESHGLIIRIPEVPGVPPYLQALWSRYWYTQFWSDKVLVISDVDMLPISRSYFVDQLESIPDTTYLHLDGKYPRLPSCYHVAMGKKFQETLEINMNFSSSLYRIMEHLGHEGLSPLPLVFWGADESYSTSRLVGKNRIEMFSRGWPSGRIDRNNWIYDPLKISDYIDAHLPRPFSEHKKEIFKLDAEVREHHRAILAVETLATFPAGQP